MSCPDDEVLEEMSSESFYPGKVERLSEEAGVLEAEDRECVEAEVESEVSEEFQMEPQPGFTSARYSEPHSPARARPHRSRPSRLDSIDAHDFADYDSEQPKQVTVSFLPSDLRLIEDLRSQLSGQQGEELTGGEVVRLALRCFKTRPAVRDEQQEFRPQSEESSLILTS
ncbi:MAG: hypothetical protein AAGH89_00150 [Verrucomicrobiota bacterium]